MRYSNEIKNKNKNKNKNKKNIKALIIMIVCTFKHHWRLLLYCCRLFGKGKSCSFLLRFTYCQHQGNLLALSREDVSACYGRGRGYRGLRDDHARRVSSASSKHSVRVRTCSVSVLLCYYYIYFRDPLLCNNVKVKSL